MAVVLAMTIGAVGCTQQQRTPCKIATAAFGAVIGAGAGTGAAVAAGPDSGHNGGAIFAGVAGGAIVGTLVGVGIGALACPEPLPPAPPPPPAPPAPGTTLETLEGPHFAFASAELLPEGRARVAAVAKRLRETPGVKVRLDGYTDDVGSDAFNLRLSERRATTVRDALVAEGIAAERVSVRGLGRANPVADNATPEGRAKNRRVEIIAQ